MNDIEKYAYKTGAKSNLLPISNKNKKYSGIKLIKECALCKHIKEIENKKFGMCSKCYKWCQAWIIKTYSQYNRLKIPEAMAAYYEPVLCKYCGTKLEPKEGEARVSRKRRPVCSRCEMIYKDAVKDAAKPKYSGYKYRSKR